MLYRVLGFLCLCIVLHIIQADDCAAGNCFAFLCFGTHAIVLVAGVRLLGQAACLNRNGGGIVIDPCRTSIGFSILYFTCYHVLYRVLGVLGLCIVLHIIQFDDCAAGNCIAFLCFGTHAIVLVAGVRLLGQAACLNRNGGGFVIDPCRTSIGFSILYFTCYHVLYRVLGVLGLCFVLIPHCRKGNIVTGHCERGGGASRIILDAFHAFHSPAFKGVAGASGLAGCIHALYPIGSARYYTLRGCSTIPSSAFTQIISHIITRLIFGIEGSVFCQRIRETHGELILTIPIPAGECVGDTVNNLGGFKCFTCHIRQLCRFARFVVLATQVSICRLACIHHLIGSRANIFTLDNNLTVQMNIHGGTIILGDLERNQCNTFNIIIANGDMELIFKALLVVFNYRIPNRRVFLDLIAVVRPTDNTLVNIVFAVFVVDPVCAFHIDRCITNSLSVVVVYIREPLIGIIGIGVGRRVNQAENCCLCLVRLIRILVLHNFNALGCRSHGVIRIGDRKCNVCRALAFAGHNAVLIYAKDLRVVAGPLTSVVFSTSLLNDLGCKLNRLELSYLISTINRYFRHLGEIGHCDFNGFCNNRSIGSFVRTCSSHCVLRHYREGDLNRSFTGRFHTCNRCLGCIARNWCNCCLGVITGFPSAGIALRVFRHNFGRKVNCFVLRHACRFSILAVDLDRG